MAGGGVVRDLLLLFLSLGAPFTAFGADRYCIYFGGVSQDTKPEDRSMFQLENDKCAKGDALHLIIYDRMDGVRGREVMYLAAEIAQLCELELPVTVIGQVAPGNGETGAHHAVCTYAGARRRHR